MRTLIGRFHDARAAAGDDGKLRFDQLRCDLNSRLVLPASGLGPRRTEHRDGPPQLRERTETLDELGLDAQHTPRVFVKPMVTLVRLQEPARRCGGRHILATQEHGAATVVTHFSSSRGRGAMHHRATRLGPRSTA